MGAEVSVLKDVEMGERVDSTSHLFKTWTDICPSRYQNTTNTTTFVRVFKETDTDETRNFFGNGIGILRQLRHPAIVNYIASSFLADEACLVCERVKPLDIVLDSLHPVEVLSGLQNILDALVFLHDRGHIYHNNLCPDAVFVCPNGEFKLGSFECAQKADNSRHWVLSHFAKTIKQPAFLCPEDQSLIKTDAPCYARDSYGFGKLIEFLTPYFENYITDTQKVSVDQAVRSLTNEKGKMRPEIGTFSKSDIFQNDITNISQFLTNLPLQSLEDKEVFFRTLVDRVRQLPYNVTARRLVKMMLSRYTLLDPHSLAYFLPHLLTPSLDDGDSGIYTSELFKKHVIPELCRIFCVREKAVRLSILTYFHCYVRQFSKKTLEEHILPELLLGMKDIDEEIVSESLRCLALVVPILGGPTVTGLNHDKYFCDGAPKTIDAGSVPKFTCESPVPQAKTLAKEKQTLSPIREKLATNASREDILQLNPNNPSSDQHAAKMREAASFVTCVSETETITQDENEPWEGWEDENQTETILDSSRILGVDTVTLPEKDDIAANLLMTGKVITPKSSPSAKKNIDDDHLGAEFEIKAVAVVEKKVEGDEVDFFADMQPDLNKKDKAFSKIDEKKNNKKPANIFQMVTNEVDVNSWANEDDGGWKIEED